MKSVKYVFFFFSREQVLQKCCVEILQVKEKKKQILVLTGVINIVFDRDVAGPSGSLDLTKTAACTCSSSP